MVVGWIDFQNMDNVKQQMPLIKIKRLLYLRMLLNDFENAGEVFELKAILAYFL